MKPAINISVPFSFKGNVYHGLSVLDGVNLALVDAPCGSCRKMLSFSNCQEAPTGIFFDGVTAFDDKSGPIQGYLKIRAI